MSYHLVADVPVAAFLSAGVDSGALVGLMRDAGATDIQTVTIGFEEFRGRQDDETPLAADVAAFYGTRHTTRMVSRSEFETDLPRILDAMDQPSIDGVNTWFVAKATRELGLKVAISGLGGDEVLGGYPSFRDIPRWVRLLRAPSAIPFLGKAGRMLGRPLIDALKLNPKAAGMLELGGSYAGAYLLKRGLFMPWELRRILGADMVRDGLRRLDPLQRIRSVIDPQPASAQGCVAALEACVYMRNQLLRDTDWASMAHSIEVRVPLVDSRLLDRLAPLSARISPGEGKSILARAPSRPLPASISNRAKTGFTTPVANWMDAAMRRDAPLARRRAPRPEPWAREWSRFIAAKAMAAGV